MSGLYIFVLGAILVAIWSTLAECGKSGQLRQAETEVPVVAKEWSRSGRAEV